MLIESIKISDLSLDPANARKHSDKNLGAIKGSLKKFGQQKPIVVDKNGVVVAGNGTLTAAKALGWEKIDAVRTELTGPEAIAFALADNRTAELAEWDIEPLTKTLQSLKDIDFDLGAIGFDQDFMGAHTPEKVIEGLTDPDEVPENVETRCKPGDLWVLGNHRLLCGDSTNVQHVEKLMGGKKADMVYTDPPYGMNLDTKFQEIHSGASTGKNHRKVIGDQSYFDAKLLWPLAGETREVFIWGADYFCNSIPDCESGSWVVWDKTCGRFEGRIGNEFELCWSKNRHKREIARSEWVGYNGMQTEDTKSREHPNQKPVRLTEWFFERWGNADDIVVDIFLGSGSTLIACEKTGRSCFGLEIDPHYCSVIIKRWEDFTGKKAQLQDSLVSVKGTVDG